jgi:4-aminobutyrate aminotransferase
VKFICRTPGKKSIEIIKRDHRVNSGSNSREYSFVFKRASGSYVWDVDGRKYLDFSAGIAVNNVGHANKDVLKAVKEQLTDGMHAAFGDFYAETPVRFIEELLSHAPKSLNNVFLSNSGTESVEAMYKAARWHTNKKWVIAFKNSFHGRTMGSLSMTNSKKVQRARFGPFLPVKHVEYPYTYRFDGTAEECSKSCLDRLEKTMKSVKTDLAAVVLEPIQGEGGYIVPPRSFVKGVRELCDKYNALMCVDEVQSGCYRTGTFLALEHFGVKADIISLSKAIGGGVPLGATIARKEVFNWDPGSHSNTFGGNLLACAAGIAVLKFMKQKRLGENATKVGDYMMKRLSRMKEEHEIIGDVRGKGLMIGIEIVKDRKSKRQGVDERHRILCDASSKGLILLPCGKSTIRICPPLTLTRKEAEQGLDILEEAIG